MTEAGFVRERQRLARALVEVWGIAPNASLLLINALPAGPSLGFLDDEGSRFTVQLAADRIPAWRRDRITTGLQTQLRARRVTPPDIELCPRSAYPHEGNLWTRKFRRGAR